MTDREKVLQQARTYIGVDGDYVCNEKLHLGFVCDWCAYSISSIMKDCGFIGKYQGGIYGFASDAAREDDGVLGEWFLKGEKPVQAGDYIMFRYSSFINPIDKYSASHVGLVESVDGDVITTLEGNVDGYGDDWAGTSSFKRKTRYLSSPDVYAFYRPYWKNETKSTSTGSKASGIDIFYQVHTIGGDWLPNVKNLEDFAGLEGKKIDGIRAHTSKGSIRYRVKLVGGTWLPWVVNREDYAGEYGEPIDCVQMEICGLSSVSEYAAEYRVSTLNKNYLEWVQNYNVVNDDGYAGLENRCIDRLQVKIVKK